MALLSRELLWVGCCIERRHHSRIEVMYGDFDRRRATPVRLSSSFRDEGMLVGAWGWKCNGDRKRRRRSTVVVRAAAQESLYEILGVSSSATEKEIKRAYRSLALKFHPDVNKQPGAQEKFLRIKNAYQTLVDSKSRSKYDASNRSRSADWDPFQWSPSPGSKQRSPRQQEEFYGFDDFFKDLQSDRQKRNSATSTKPKSLWEELADIGEEFVEFLEKELNFSEADEKPSSNYSENPRNNTRQRSSKSDTNDSDASQQESPIDQQAKVDNDIAEIEDMLAKLKKEMGM